MPDMKIKLGMSNGIGVGNFGVLGGGGPTDTTRPTCTITCAQTGPTATTPLNMTFTFSEIVTGFELGDITAGNGTAGNFAGSGTTYTADVTPTATGAVTVDVAEGVCVDEAGNTNTAATQFSIVAIVYALRDLFTTDEASPLTSPRTAEPGPGTEVIVDTGNRASITGAKLRMIGSVGADWGQPGVWGAAQTRVAGLAMLATVKSNTRTMFGWDTNQSGTVEENAYHNDASDSNAIQTRLGGVSIKTGATFNQSATEKYAVILRSAGALFIKDDQLEYVDRSRNTATVYPAIVRGDSAIGAQIVDYDYFSVAALPAPFNTDNGLATQVLAGSRSVNDAFVHEANCIITFTATTKPSAGDAEVRFRIQDATNYWAFRWNSDGGGRIFEVVDDVATQRGGIPTDSLANGGHVLIRCSGTSIRMYYVNKIQADYSSATNFQTETDGKVGSLGTGGALSDIVSWPKTLGAAAQAVIDANFT